MLLQDRARATRFSCRFPPCPPISVPATQAIANAVFWNLQSILGYIYHSSTARFQCSKLQHLLIVIRSFEGNCEILRTISEPIKLDLKCQNLKK